MWDTLRSLMEIMTTWNSSLCRPLLWLCALMLRICAMVILHLYEYDDLVRGDSGWTWERTSPIQSFGEKLGVLDDGHRSIRSFAWMTRVARNGVKPLVAPGNVGSAILAHGGFHVGGNVDPILSNTIAATTSTTSTGSSSTPATTVYDEAIRVQRNDLNLYHGAKIMDDDSIHALHTQLCEYLANGSVHICLFEDAPAIMSSRITSRWNNTQRHGIWIANLEYDSSSTLFPR